MPDFHSHFRLGLLAALAAGLYTMAGLLVPLWAVAIDLSPQAVGLVAGAGSLVPMLLAVPAGALAGRLGAQRLLGLAAVLAIGAALAGPFARDVTTLVAIQLLGGLGRAIVWMAAQTYLVQLGNGAAGARRAVLFSFASMFGTLLSPLVVGLVVQEAGYAAAFLTVGAAYAVLVLVNARLPAPAVNAHTDGAASPRVAVRVAAELAQSRGMPLVLLGTFLRFASGSLRLAFFPLYLDGLGLPPLAIGLLVGFGNLVSVGGVLAAGPLLARLGPLRLLYLALLLALGALAATPIATSLLLLGFLSAFWGIGMGLSLPALLHQIGQGARAGEQGLAVGLRQTVNEAAALASPLSLGLASVWVGVDGGFYLVGGGLAALALGGLIEASRRGDLRDESL